MGISKTSILLTSAKRTLQMILDHLSNPKVQLADLQLFRFVYCLLLLQIHFDRKNHSISMMTHNLNFNPIPLFESFGIGRFDVESFEWLYLSLIFALILSAIGVATRVSLFISAVLFFLVHGQLLSLTKSADSDYVYHSKNIVVFVLIILGFDSNINKSSFITKLWREIRSTKDRLISGHSLNLIVITFGLIYFGASYVRLLTSGLQWMDGYTLQAYLMTVYLSDNVVLAYQIAQHYYLCVALSLLLMVFEFGFIFAFFLARPYLILLIGSFALHYSIFKVMGINFFKFHGFALIVYAFLPPFSLGFRLKKSTGAGSGQTFLKSYEKSFSVIFCLVMLGCIFFRIESWPFSDWRVYSHPKALEHVFFHEAIAEVDGEITYPLRRNGQYLLVDELFAKIKEENYEQDLEKLCKSVIGEIASNSSSANIYINRLQLEKDMTISKTKICEKDLD
jgi:hypothetical protein